MAICLVCKTNPTPEAIRCQKCGWPVGGVEAISHRALQQEVLQWIREKYDATQLTDVPSDFTTNTQIENVQNFELLKSEMAVLRDKIKIIEDQQSKSGVELNSLSDRSREIDQSIKKIDQSISKTIDFFNAQNNENLKINDQILVYEKRLKVNEIQIQELSIGKQQQPVSSFKSAMNNKLVSTSASMVTPQVATSAPELRSETGEGALLKEYNGYSQEVPKSLRDGSKNVSIKDDAVVRIRDGNESNITFKYSRNGNFFIISRGGYCYLVPNKQRRIISQIYTVAQAIYKCDGYSENYQDFRLIKPALVSEESDDCWKLSQKGTLEFT